MASKVKIEEADEVASNSEQLDGIFITESFKSKKEALKQDVIYVFFFF